MGKRRKLRGQRLWRFQTHRSEVRARKAFDIHQGQFKIRLVKLGIVLLTTAGVAFVSHLASGEKAEISMKKEQQKFGLAVHGGAGTIERSKMSPERESDYRTGIERALTAGDEILQRDGSSLDAVEAAVRAFEDDPHFNAGRGAVFANSGTNELDAAIMDGKTLNAGAVANLRHIRNPVSLARLVMEKSKHVFMAGDGAETFARQNGVSILTDQKYFYTEERWQALQKIKAAEEGGAGGKKFIITDEDRHGTVGAVALDKNGNLAAATSTGGTTNKKAGRIGDTPVIGAGTYANNATCAVSATGDGEYFIRATVAHDISALMEYRGMKLQEAAQTVLDKIARLGGTGGLIAIDRDGNVVLPFNTSGHVSRLRRSKRQVRRRNLQIVLPPFSAVIPCFNEAVRIGETLRLTLDYLASNAPESELIVVNDGSTDATSTVAREALAGAKIATRLLENFPNRGKGAAVRTGLLAAQKPIGLFFDADLSTPLEETPKLIEPIAGGEIDIAFGSRALDRKLIGIHQPWRREQAGRIFNLLVRAATGLPFWDTQCGFKAFRMFAAQFWQPRASRVSLSMSSCFIWRDNVRLRLREIPVRWNHAEGSKIHFLRDSLRMLHEIIALRTF